MADWQLKFVPFTPTATGSWVQRSAKGAELLGKLVGEHSVDGWEFHRIEHYTLRDPPGCLAGLFGVPPVVVTLDVVVFRRPM